MVRQIGKIEGEYSEEKKCRMFSFKDRKWIDIPELDSTSKFQSKLKKFIIDNGCCLTLTEKHKKDKIKSSLNKIINHLQVVEKELNARIIKIGDDVHEEVIPGDNLVQNKRGRQATSKSKRKPASRSPIRPSRTD